MKSYTKEEDDVIKEHYPVGGKAAVTQLLDRQPEGIRKRANALGVFYTGGNRIIGEVNNAFLLKEVERLTHALEKEKQRTAWIDATIKTSISKMNIGKVKVPSFRKAKNNQEMHVERSDTHSGLEISPDQTQNLGHYNFSIYKKYVGTLKEKIFSFLYEDKKSQGLNKLVMPYMGDMVEGDGNIYPSQAYHMSMSVLDQVFETAKVECELILALASEIQELEIFCVPGNHGKVGGKKVNTNPMDNWDYVFYKVLKLMLEHQENVKVLISSSPTMLVKHGDFNL